MKIVLERHQYAPELNTAYIGPTLARVPAPGCTTITEVRQKLFRRLTYRGRYVTLCWRYPSPHAGLDYPREGFCNDLRSLRGAITVLEKRLDKSKNPQLEIKTRLIG